MSSPLETAFSQAMQDVQGLDERPSVENLLKLYALFKQATEGDVSQPKPGFSDLVGRAKWDAWNALKGQSSETAQQGYIDLINSLR